MPTTPNTPTMTAGALSLLSYMPTEMHVEATAKAVALAAKFGWTTVSGTCFLQANKGRVVVP